MKRIIGVIGTVASGKSLVAEYIVKRCNISAFEISQPLKDIAIERRISVTRDALIELGREVARTHGPDYLAKILLQRCGDMAVICGMRQVPQIEYLRANSDLVLISIDAEPAKRFDRVVECGKAGEAKSVEELIANEMVENAGPVQRLFDCMALADHKLRNDSTTEALFIEVDRLLLKEKLIK